MNPTLQSLIEAKREVMTRASAVMAIAQSEQRDVNPSENADLQRMLLEVDDLNARIRQESSLEDRAKLADSVRSRYASILSADPASTFTSAELPTLWSDFRTRGFAAADVATSQPFRETRALGSAGGSAIATTFADQVVVYQRTASPMLDPNVVTISTSASGAPFTVPRLSADISYGGTVVAEAGTLPTLDPTISAVTLTPYKYGAITLWSAELDQDEIIELQPLIARSTGRELGLDIGAHLTTGDGSGKPQGFVGAAGIGGTATVTFGGTASTFFDYGDLVELWGSVSAPYRSTGVWQLSTDAFVKVQRFRDDNGNLVLLPGLQGGAPTLLGRPVYENPAMAAVGSASKSVAFGDFRQYWVRRVEPMRVELSRDFKYDTDQVALKVVERIDGDLIDTSAVKTLVSANT